MTESIQEVVEFINSCSGIDWDAEARHIAQSGQKTAREATLDLPLTVVIEYPFCDCGEPVLERQENMAEPPLVIMGYEYMETCYECSVVSSD